MIKLFSALGIGADAIAAGKGKIVIGTPAPKIPSALVTDGSIAGSSFKLAKPSIKHRLVMSVEGPEKEGKTHFALTAPGPISFQDIDIGTEGVIDKFIAHKEIHLAEYELPSDQPGAVREWNQLKNDFEITLGSTAVRSAILDNATEAWDLVRLAKLGKLTQVMPHLYTQVNAEFRKLIRLAYKSDTNLILLHKKKKMYVNEQWNGKYERSGFADIGYLVQVMVECYKQDKKFYLRVLACRQNPEIEGLVIEDPSFAKLGIAVFPDTKLADWQ
jgi:hypothetical protein